MTASTSSSSATPQENPKKSEMKSISRIAALMAIALAAMSCFKNSDIVVSRVSTIVTASGGKLLTDRGETFVAKNSIEGNDLSSGRWFVSCDILANHGQGLYEVNVLSIFPVLVKDILQSSSPLDADKLVEDPISIDNIWVSGGFINMETMIYCIKDSETKHMLNLVLDTEASNADTLYFNIRHNAFKEKPENPVFASQTFVGGVSYSSFPLGSLPAPIEKKIVLTFRYPWYLEFETYKQRRCEISGIYEPEDK